MFALINQSGLTSMYQLMLTVYNCYGFRAITFVYDFQNYFSRIVGSYRKRRTCLYLLTHISGQMQMGHLSDGEIEITTLSKKLASDKHICLLLYCME